MRRLIFIAALLNTILFQSISQTKNFIDQPYIETIAKVDTLVAPDRIFLEIIITEKDTKGKISVEELESKMESTLKSMGILTEKQLTLNDLSSKFGKYILKEQDVLKTKIYSLQVDNALSAGKVIIALEKMEISNLAIERIEYSKIDMLSLELKTKAIIKAKKQAEHMCSPLNQKVGAALFISDFSETNDNSQNNSYREGSERYEIKSLAYNYKLADIQFDKIRVETIVRVKFKIE